MPQAVIIAAIQAAVTIAIEMSKSKGATDSAAYGDTAALKERQTVDVKKFFEEINSPEYRATLEADFQKAGIELELAGQIDSAEELRAAATLMKDLAWKLYTAGQSEAADDLTAMAQTYELMADKADANGVESGAVDAVITTDTMFTNPTVHDLSAEPGSTVVEDQSPYTIQDVPAQESTEQTLNQPVMV
jgi:hypothetical protein